MKSTIIENILLVVTPYVGIFKKKDKRGYWREFDRVGNAGVAMDTATLLRKVGHNVEVVSMEEDEQ